VFGYPAGALLTYQNFRAKVHPEDIGRVEDSLQHAVDTGQEYVAEFRFILPDGTARWLLGRGGKLLGENGDLIGLSGINMDITDRKLAEQRLVETARVLQEHESQLAMVFSAASMGDFSWEIERDQVFCHASIWEMYGEDPQHPPESHPTAWFLQRVHPEDVPVLRQALNHVAQRGAALDMDFRIMLSGRPLRWVQVRGSAIRDEQGKTIRLKGLNIDITARKQAELKLRQSEEQFRLLANSIPQVVWTARPDGTIDYYNDQWYAMTGFDRTSSKGEQWHPIVHPDDLVRTAERWAESIVAGQPFEIECRYWDVRHQDFRWHLARGLPIRDAAGHIIRWVATSTDIHEQRAARELLERQVALRTEDLRRSLQEKEILLKELHHRVKSNLQVVSSLLQMQSESLTDQGAIRALLDSRQRVHSMAMIHERLYGTRQMSEIDFGDYARALVNELFDSLSHGGNITVRVETSSFPLTLEQAIPCGLILNELVTNAFKYAYGPGQRGEILIELSEQDRGRVRLRVTDEGRGMPAHFDLMTASSLGLSVVSVLAKQLGGTLDITSPPQGGSSFTVIFPRENRRSQDVSAA
jgi:PAS domain S-box-containing protein